MRIAQVAPLFESVPPKYYGGTERVVSYLTEELVAQGHDVTLFASGDSVTAATLESVWHRSLRLDESCVDHMAPHIVLIEHVAQEAAGFDVVHFHVDYLHFPISRRSSYAHVTTLHGRLDIPDIIPLFGRYKDMPVVSISDSQREPMPWLNWAGTIHHGLPADLYRFQPDPGRYFAFLGRISPEKRVDRAIEIAKHLDTPIRIAAKVDAVDHAYFQSAVEPLLDHPLVEFVGEIGDGEKQEFLGNAIALLFPIDWPEPFGLVMIESMACGTPVVAYRRGSVPEVVEDGRTGFIVSDQPEAIAAAAKAACLDRAQVRRGFEERFTSHRVAREYAALYERLALGAPGTQTPAVAVDTTGAAVVVWKDPSRPDPDRRRPKQTA